jgi:hypothetical protein
MKCKSLVFCISLLLISDISFAQGILPSWMRRGGGSNEGQESPQPPTKPQELIGQKKAEIPKLVVEVESGEIASNGEVVISINKATQSASISSVLANGIELGGFSDKTKLIKKYIPNGKSSISFELTDEFGQKFSKVINFERVASVAQQKPDSAPRLVAKVSSSEMAPNGEVIITISNESTNNKIASLTVNGFELGGFTEKSKAIKRYMPVGKTNLAIEMTDEYGQKFTQNLSFDRLAPTGADQFAQMPAQVITSQETPNFKLPPPTTKKVAALVIGNSNYVMSPLANPKNDATDVANKLEEMGYKVRRVIDADRRSMLKNLAAFREEAEKAEVGFVYYAGHGVQVGGINYILPIDFNLESGMASIQFDGIAVNQMLENFVPTETKLAFLDACRDNPLSRSLSKTRGGNNSGLAPMDAISGTLISFSTKDGSVAQDGNGRNSPYTKALLEHLGDQVDVSLMLRRVRQKVITETSGKQVPWDYGSLVGDELVLGKGKNRITR